MSGRPTGEIAVRWRCRRAGGCTACAGPFRSQQLATINKKTGRAHLFGVPVPGLAVMAMAFGPHGTLYAVGGCNLDPVTFECTPGPPT